MNWAKTAFLAIVAWVRRLPSAMRQARAGWSLLTFRQKAVNLGLSTLMAAAPMQSMVRMIFWPSDHTPLSPGAASVCIAFLLFALFLYIATHCQRVVRAASTKDPKAFHEAVAHLDETAREAKLRREVTHTKETLESSVPQAPSETPVRTRRL